jgi:FG-GAP-like repeat/HYR domain
MNRGRHLKTFVARPFVVATAAILVALIVGVGDAQAAAEFAPGTSYPVNGLQVATASSDLNGDGFSDIVSASQNGDNFSVLLARGDGTFSSPTAYPVGANPGVNLAGPMDIQVADVNGDGHPDVVTADWRGTFIPGSISVFLGRGDGTFAPPAKFATDVEPVSVALGDVNGDGFLDAVTANFRASSVSLLLGNGDGTFRPQTVLPEYYPAVSAVALADMNNDGRQDLVAEVQSAIYVSLGRGDGSFSTPTRIAATTGYFGDVEVADLNGDGNRDVVVPGEFADLVSVLLGHGDGSFAPAVTYPTGAGTYPVAVIAVDFDGDGVLDLATANANSSMTSILAGAGDGTFAAPSLYNTGQEWAVAAGRFNRDARPDLALGQFNNVKVLLNVTGGPLPPSDVTPPTIVVPDAVVAEATSPAGATVNYTVTATDDVDPAPVVSCTPASGSTFPLGDTTVTCTASDAAGNRATASFVIYVRDTTPPSLTLPGDLVVDATSPAGADVSFGATATDAVDPTPVVTCTRSPGTFPIGDTKVICTATDSSGNQASASFLVHVRGAVEQITGLMKYVDDKAIGPGTSLHDKLAQAQSLVAAGQLSDACAKLGAFVSEVRALPSGQLSGDQSQYLIAAAERIRAVIGC